MKKANKKGDVELKIYELLGVKYFRFLVFKLEKIIHHKDKMKNINYHVKKINIDEITSFKKYLYYNGYIHVRNLIFLFIILLISLNFINLFFLIVIVLELIKNAYCVMLQRYNYIRINQIIQKKKEFISRKNQNREKNLMQEELSLKLDNSIMFNQLEELKHFFEGQENVILTDKYRETLLILKRYLDCYNNNENRDLNCVSKSSVANITQNEYNNQEFGLKRERKL